MILEELRIWKSGQQLYSLLRFRNDSETEKVIPNQFNGETDDSYPGVSGTDRVAVIAGAWQGNRASVSGPLGCTPWGPPVQGPSHWTWFAELSRPPVYVDRSLCAYGLNLARGFLIAASFVI